MPTFSDRKPLGIEKGVVRLQDHDPRWSSLFQFERDAILGAMGPLAIDVQHVGSTAIAGIKAKPLLDIAVGVASLDDLPLFRCALEPLGYEYAHWAGLDDNLVFGRGVVRTHLIHVVQYGGQNWHHYLKFRDALLADRGLAAEYEALKVTLATAHAESRAAYTLAKNDFIAGVLQRSGD